MNPVKRKDWTGTKSEAADTICLYTIYSQSYWHSHFSLNLLTVNLVYSIIYSSLKLNVGRSLVAQWLRLCFHCRSTHSIVDLGTKILHATGHGQKKKKRQKETRINNKNYTLRMFTLIWQKLLFPNRLVVIPGNTTDHIFSHFHILSDMAM